MQTLSPRSALGTDIESVAVAAAVMFPVGVGSIVDISEKQYTEIFSQQKKTEMSLKKKSCCNHGDS